MSYPHAAAYAKLPTRDQQQQQQSQQSQEMTPMRAPPGDAVDTRFLLRPPPYHSSNGSSNGSSSSTTSPTESTPFTSGPSAPDSSHAASSSSSSSSSFVADSSAVEIREADEDEQTGGSAAASSAAGTTTGDAATVAGLVVLDKGPPSPGEATLTLMRLGGTGLGNVQLNVALSSRVGDMLQRVYAREIHDGARVRVVFMGRMLGNDEVLGAAGVAHGCILHTHVMAGGGAPDSSQQQQPLVLDDQGNPVPQGEVLINDLDDADAAAIAAAEGLYPGQYTPAQLALMRRAQLEHAQQQHGGFAPREGSPADFVLGFLLGFILGAISIIWLYSPTLSRKQRLGILLGLAFNLLLMLYNSLHPEQKAEATDGANAVVPDPRQPGGGIANG